MHHSHRRAKDSKTALLRLCVHWGLSERCVPWPRLLHAELGHSSKADVMTMSLRSLVQPRRQQQLVL